MGDEQDMVCEIDVVYFMGVIFDYKNDNGVISHSKITRIIPIDGEKECHLVFLNLKNHGLFEEVGSGYIVKESDMIFVKNEDLQLVYVHCNNVCAYSKRESLPPVGE